MSAKSLAVTVFGETAQLPVARKELASGAISIGFMSKKAYGEKHNLKGQALRRAHNKYRAEFGVLGNQGMASLQAGGQIVLAKISERMNKDKEVIGYTARYDLASELDAGTARALTTEELAEELKARGLKIDDKMLLALVSGQQGNQAQPQQQPQSK